MQYYTEKRHMSAVELMDALRAYINKELQDAICEKRGTVNATYGGFCDYLRDQLEDALNTMDKTPGFTVQNAVTNAAELLSHAMHLSDFADRYLRSKQGELEQQLLKARTSIMPELNDEETKDW